jgi:hypothetical protein
MLRRIGVAYCVAPLAAVFAVWATMFALAAVNGERIPVTTAFRVLPYYFLVGAPIAYLVAGVVGFPVLLWLRRRGNVRLVSLLTLGAAGGTVAFGLIPFVLAEAQRPQLPVLAIGAEAGAVAALVFWAIAVRDSTSRSAA